MFLLAKYGVQTDIHFPMIKRGVVDLAASADWTPATGDTKISKDGGAVANTTNNPAAVSGTGSVLWALTLTASELTAASVLVQIVDSATKAVEDQVVCVYTYGNASAKIPVDLSDLVRMGLTALPNANAAASGGLPTVDASNAVKIQSNIKKNQALANFMFLMTDSTNHNPATGKTVTATRSIDGAAFASGTLGSVTEIANGMYKVDLAAGDTNGNNITLRFAATGCDDLFVTLVTEP